MGVYIDHPKYENTRKPKILAHTRDKEVIHQTVIFLSKTKLATFLSKAIRLSQASLELSSSRGVFGSLENERKRREKRANEKLRDFIYKKMKSCPKDCLGLQKHRGLYRPPKV